MLQIDYLLDILKKHNICYKCGNQVRKVLSNGLCPVCSMREGISK